MGTFPLPIPNEPLVPPPISVAGLSPPRTLTDEITESVQILDLGGDTTTGISSPYLESSEISTLLSVALLQALNTLQSASFPMPASLLYSAHILPNRPAYIPRENREDVVISRSEWKKLAKWMKEVAKEGLLKIKETKGEVVVQGYASELSPPD